MFATYGESPLHAFDVDMVSNMQLSLCRLAPKTSRALLLCFHVWAGLCFRGSAVQRTFLRKVDV